MNILDNEQMKVVLDNSNSLLVVAGAGSGKTFTIVEKIKYLIDQKNIKEEEILCISFTNESTNNLKNKLNDYNIDCFTFHKLSLNILNNNNIYFEVCSSDYLEYIIDEFFNTVIYEYPIMIRLILKYYDSYVFYKNKNKLYKSLIKDKCLEIESLKRIISKFIHLFKTNNYSLKDFNMFYRRIFFRKKKILLKIILNIYLYYINELSSSLKIDFDDMIIKASQVINTNGIIKKYKYLIIDEYQDTSYIRHLLIKSIIDKTKCKFIGVGDDFQSIYRFTGCDLDIFINFDKYYNDSNIVKINHTYRTSQELIYVAGSFVMKNKYQISKNLLSSKYIDKPIIIYYDVDKILFKELINNINTPLLIIGRNNNDIYKYIDNDFVFNNNIKYLTVHRAKGLESDNVIVLNVVDDKLGFPNKIEDDSILRLVTSKKDKYLYEEERRLFYVALTRTKNYVYLLTNSNKESMFIKELLRDYKKYIQIKRP